MVRGGLVDVPVALLVDDDHAGDAPVGDQEEGGGVAGDDDGGGAPHLVHEVGHRTQPQPFEEAVAVVALGRGAPVGAGGRRQVLLAQPLVAREAAGGQDDAAAGVEGDLAAVVAGAYPRDAPGLVRQQPCHGRAEPQVAAVHAEGVAQPGDERFAQGQRSAAGGQGLGGAQPDAGTGSFARPGAGGHVEVSEVVGGEGESVGGQRGAPQQGALVGGKPVEVEDLRLDRTPAHQPAGPFGVVVAVSVGVDESDLRSVVELPQHAGPLRQIRLLPGGRHPVADGGVQIGAAGGVAVVEPGGGEVEARGHPDGPAGQCGGSPVQGGLLQYDGGQAAQPCGESGGEAARSGADDDDVEGVRAAGVVECSHGAPFSPAVRRTSRGPSSCRR
ncbi:hypothetical protein STAL104432_21830 [Streptomyces albus]